jgi:broad specificity phosphatase PhoE
VRLILVRHGESTWNAQGRMQGVADPPLSDAGRAQARALAPLLEPLESDVVRCSDLERARETVGLLGLDGAVADPRWREADLGDWAGRLVQDVIAEDEAAYRGWLESRHTPPGGEAWADTCARVEAAARDLASSGARSALVVTHGGPVRAACATLAGLPRSGLVPVPTASVTVIEMNGRPRLRAFGVTRRPAASPAPD